MTATQELAALCTSDDTPLPVILDYLQDHGPLSPAERAVLHQRLDAQGYVSPAELEVLRRHLAGAQALSINTTSYVATGHPYHVRLWRVAGRKWIVWLSVGFRNRDEARNYLADWADRTGHPVLSLGENRNVSLAHVLAILRRW